MTGTPTETGTFHPNFIVTDQGSQTANKQITLVIAPGSGIVITSPQLLPTGAINQAYSYQVQWTGGVAPFTVTGSGLPAWLSVNNSGQLSGTPLVGGPYSFSLTVTDAQSPVANSASQNFTILVNPPTITTTSPLTPAIIGQAYSNTLAATGGTPAYRWSATGLPEWLSLSSDGVLSGTPPAGGPSQVNFTAKVTDSLGAYSTADLVLPVQAPGLAFLTTSPITAATANAFYTSAIQVTGGVTPYSFSATELPVWLSIASDGTLSGTPPAAGPVTFTVIVTDAKQTSLSQLFTLPVNAALTFGNSPAPATMGIAYSFTFTASGGSGSYQWSATGLPNWLTLSSTGLLSGTPPAAGAVPFTVTLLDTATENSIQQAFSLSVNASLVILTSSPLQAATVNSPYTATFTASGGGGSYVWSATGLPQGFAISPDGVLTGTPSSAAAIQFSVTVTDALRNTQSQSFTLPVNAALTIDNQAALAPATVGTAYSANFTASGGTRGYAWSASGLPDWLSLTPAGYLSGTPPAPGPVSFTVTVTDSSEQSASGVFTLTAYPALAITTPATLIPGTIGIPYSTQLAATGGVGAYSWAGLNLPAWLNVSTSGLLSGTPPAGGTATFSVTVSDTANHSVTQAFSLTIYGQLAITTTSPLDTGTVNIPYLQHFAAAGGSGVNTWTATGLPSWLTMSAAGNLSGTPVSDGTVTFNVTVADNVGHSATQPFSLTVNQSLAITTTVLPQATVGVAYLTTLRAIGGTGVYSWTAADLPAWLTLSTSGTLSGKPLVAGVYHFTSTDTDSHQITTSRQFTLLVSTGTPLAFVTLGMPDATAGISYTASLTAGGGVPPYTYALAQGSSISPLTLSANGTILGTPSTAGTVSFTAQVTDAAEATATRQFTIQVNGLLGIDSASLPAGTVGAAYSAALHAHGGNSPYGWNLVSGSLPAGLSLDSSGGISGTPTAAGSFSFYVQATSGNQTSTPALLTILIQSAPLAPLTITSPSQLPPGTLNSAYSFALGVSGGKGPYSWSISSGSLPAGLTLSSPGAIGGTPTTAQIATFAATVTDAAGTTAGGQFSLPDHRPRSGDSDHVVAVARRSARPAL